MGRKREFSQGFYLRLDRQGSVLGDLQIFREIHHRFRGDGMTFLVVKVEDGPDRMGGHAHEHHLRSDGTAVGEMRKIQAGLRSLMRSHCGGRFRTDALPVPGSYREDVRIDEPEVIDGVRQDRQRPLDCPLFTGPQTCLRDLCPIGPTLGPIKKKVLVTGCGIAGVVPGHLDLSRAHPVRGQIQHVHIGQMV